MSSGPLLDSLESCHLLSFGIMKELRCLIKSAACVPSSFLNLESM